MSSTRQAFLTRRRMLRGAGGAGLVAAAAAAETITGSGTAEAGTDGDVVLGASNTTNAITRITNTTSGLAAFAAFATGNGAGVFGQTDSGLGIKGLATGNGVGVEAVGVTGLHGVGVGGPGVFGESDTGVGVSGSSASHWGMYAFSDHDTGLQAQSNHAVAVVAASGMTGVYAQSGTHDGFAITHDAVRGYTDAAAGAGVRGENFFGGDGVAGFAGSGGSGVAGTTTSGAGGSAGVVGTNKGAGPGVRGIGGTGVLAQASAASSSIALSVEGPARFSLSGLVTIARGSAKATAAGVRLTRSSMVLATVQEHMPGIFIEAAVPDFDKRSITVYLSKAAAQNTKVAWFVVN